MVIYYKVMTLIQTVMTLIQTIDYLKKKIRMRRSSFFSEGSNSDNLGEPMMAEHQECWLGSFVISKGDQYR